MNSSRQHLPGALLLTAALALMLPRLPQAWAGDEDQAPAPSSSSQAAKAPAAKTRLAGHRTAAAAAASARAHPLDLKPPPLAHIYPREELRYILANPDESDDNELPAVDVQGNRYVQPVPMGQFLAIPWALMHPTQAWRIFTPVVQQ